MKKLLILSIILSPLFGYSQDTTKLSKALINRANPDAPGISAKEAINHTGSDVYVIDTVFDYKIRNKTYTVLYVGDRNANKALQIIISGSKAKINAKDWKNSLGHFTGRVAIYKGKSTIFITEQYQLSTRIEI